MNALESNSLVQKLDKMLHEDNKYTDLLEKAEKITGVKRLYIALGALSILSLYMIIGHGAGLICNTVGFVYPAYASILAIESRTKEDDTKWLTYWVVYAAFCIIEFFSDIILNWLPFYWLAKCIFLIWCFLPISNNGAQFMYHRFIRPVFLKNRVAIDDTLNKALDGATGLASAALGEASKLVAEKTLKGE